MGFDLLTTFSEEKGGFNRFQQQKKGCPCSPHSRNRPFNWIRLQERPTDCSFKGSSHSPELDRGWRGTHDGNDSTDCTQQSQAEGAVAVIEKVLGTGVAANLVEHVDPWSSPQSVCWSMEQNTICILTTTCPHFWLQVNFNLHRFPVNSCRGLTQRDFCGYFHCWSFIALDWPWAND